MADYDQQSYWRRRFETETSFEWLMPSDGFMNLMQPHISHLDASSRILHLGFGTSDLQNHFRARGLVDVTNVDYEPLAVERGRDLERQRFGDVRMRYAVGDVTQLGAGNPGEYGSYDLVVDKSTSDAVACAGEIPLRRMADAIRGRLAPGGIWIALSFSQDRFTIPNLPFHVDIIARVPTPKRLPNDPDIYHWCYLLRPA
ncbi:Methyltransferase domain [Geosmithia morbida]|uniref:Methyltransferase domain n=1 Tax=Geosmithia morbida TaxID=1094350 RepID=A0A9P5D8C9_9HYPO|nr:Methyltransferase domain [Geosmithia morbida]KAF4125389.1 Methyltransferase domain [Geosmithia morbida]